MGKAPYQGRGLMHHLVVCRPVLDELSLPAVTSCGLNMLCPDLLTPERAAAAIWSWAPGHPYTVQPSLRSWRTLWHAIMDLVHHIMGREQVLLVTRSIISTDPVWCWL